MTTSPPYIVLEYEDERGHSEFRAWRKQLHKSNPQASRKVDHLIDLLELYGTELRFPQVSHIVGPIYELRAHGSNAVRIYYWRQDATTFVVACGEVKQKNKADRKLIDKALSAYREYNEE